MQSSPFKYLPIIVVVTALSGALLFYTKREEVRTRVHDLLSQTKPQTVVKLEPTPIPTLIPQTNGSNQTNLTNSPIKKNPEHQPVDTAIDPSIFYSLAGITYLSGLAALIKSKRG